MGLTHLRDAARESDHDKPGYVDLGGSICLCRMVLFKQK
jgi:hypothetical protein